MWAFACGEVTKVRPIRIRLANRAEEVNGIFISIRHQGNVFENKQLRFIEGKTHYVLDATIPICKHYTDRMTCLFSALLEDFKLYNAADLSSKERTREKGR